MNGDIHTSMQKSNILILGLMVLIALIIIIGLTGFLYLKSNTAAKTTTNSVKTDTASNNIPTPSGDTPSPSGSTPQKLICYHFRSLDEALKHIDIACILDLNGTSKGAVSDNIAKLTNLGELDLPNNNLTQFPSVIFKLNNLWRIDLSNNQIATIPQEIASSNLVKTLQVLILKGNPISASGQQSIKKFLPNTKITF